MVTKNQIKLVVSLKQKKYRSQHGLFVVEGEKTVNELLQWGLKAYAVFADNSQNPKGFEGAEVVSKATMKQMSSLTNPSGILGVFYMPKAKTGEASDWILALDAVRDPGNLGTIIRLCDWFGITQLICSEDTVDCYNPKVLQATMGSIARINIVYTNLEAYLEHTDLVVYGAFMDGASVYVEKLPASGILVMGNEANGISSDVTKHIAQRISIPQYGQATTESLNVATATAILLNEIRR
ncbi:TrmH family RNA methyltransferase [Flagellimonas iocasae]|uniref:TrmH family RNA methyltransferase n=1 Tax=Flagellimonas iocasae TaxID=2055905 RepID=A0ABW4Y001_9FLAO